MSLNQKTPKRTNSPQKDSLLKKNLPKFNLNLLILRTKDQLSKPLWLTLTTIKMLSKVINLRFLLIIQKIEFKLITENDTPSRTQGNLHMETLINLILSRTPMIVIWRIKI